MRAFYINEHRDMADAEKQILIDTLVAIEHKAFSDPWSEKAFAESMQNPVISLMTLYEDGMLLAYALFAILPPEAELLNLAVSPSARRRGLAASLLAEAFSHLKKVCVADVFLEVRESNTPARALYKREGFLPIGKRKHYYRYPTEDAVVMMLRLD